MVLIFLHAVPSLSGLLVNSHLHYFINPISPRFGIPFAEAVEIYGASTHSRCTSCLKRQTVLLHHFYHCFSFLSGFCKANMGFGGFTLIGDDHCYNFFLYFFLFLASGEKLWSDERWAHSQDFGQFKITTSFCQCFDNKTPSPISNMGL